MGRPPKKKKVPPFIMIEKKMLKSEAWKKLSHPDRTAYLHLRAKFNGSNENDLSLTYSEMEVFMHRRTLSKAFKNLEEYGFIKRIRQGGLEKQCNIFGLSEEWRRYGQENFKIFEKTKASGIFST